MSFTSLLLYKVQLSFPTINRSSRQFFVPYLTSLRKGHHKFQFDSNHSKKIELRSEKRSFFCTCTWLLRQRGWESRLTSHLFRGAAHWSPWMVRRLWEAMKIIFFLFWSHRRSWKLASFIWSCWGSMKTVNLYFLGVKKIILLYFESARDHENCPPLFWSCRRL